MINRLINYMNNMFHIIVNYPFKHQIENKVADRIAPNKATLSMLPARNTPLLERGLEQSVPLFFQVNKEHNKKRQENEFVQKQDWKRWKNKVLGAKEDIIDALATLNREPKNAAELQALIREQRNQKHQDTFAKHHIY